MKSFWSGSLFCVPVFETPHVERRRFTSLDRQVSQMISYIISNDHMREEEEFICRYLGDPMIPRTLSSFALVFNYSGSQLPISRSYVDVDEFDFQFLTFFHSPTRGSIYSRKWKMYNQGNHRNLREDPTSTFARS